MSLLNPHYSPPQPIAETADPLCAPFANAIHQIKTLIIAEFDRQIAQNHLYYHTHAHISGVQRRSQIIFQAIAPYLELPPARLTRLSLLLDLCAIAHDAIQIFVPPTQPHTSRRREMGISEAATSNLLLKSIQELDAQLETPQFTPTDLEIVRNAIAATICDYDPLEQTIYQPALSAPTPPHLVAQILALADIGALGMEGIDAYSQEGSLLFLEENPDIIPLLQSNEIDTLASDCPALQENLRQRLLRRAHFQVNFAKSRLTRFPQEIANFPPAAIEILTQEVFPHLNPDTIQTIQSTTPTQANTSIAQLLKFFNLKQYIAAISSQPSNHPDLPC